MAWHYRPIAAPLDLEQNFRALEAYLAGLTSGPAAVKLSADVGPTTSTTLANVTGLSFALAANTSYQFSFYVLYQVDTAANGIKLAVTTPSGLINYSVELPNAADGVDADYEGQGTSSADIVQSTAIPAVNTTYIARIVGVVQNGATPGNLQVQYASPNIAVNVRIKAGASGVLTTLP